MGVGVVVGVRDGEGVIVGVGVGVHVGTPGGQGVLVGVAVGVLVGVGVFVGVGVSTAMSGGSPNTRDLRNCSTTMVRMALSRI